MRGGLDNAYPGELNLDLIKECVFNALVYAARVLPHIEPPLLVVMRNFLLFYYTWYLYSSIMLLIFFSNVCENQVTTSLGEPSYYGVLLRKMYLYICIVITLSRLGINRSVWTSVLFHLWSSGQTGKRPSRLIIWPHESGSAVPSSVSPLIFHTQKTESGICLRALLLTPDFRD